MAGPGGVDPSSPFFASLASQAAVRSGTAKTREDKKKEKVNSLRFDRLLDEQAAGETAAAAAVDIPERLRGLPPEKILEGLLDDVHSTGDALKERTHPDNIVAYKSAVRSFVRYVVDRSFTVTERTSGGNVLRRKKFTQVQVIDEKLEQLAAGILANQKNQLALLAKIEEINGLLVDLIS